MEDNNSQSKDNNTIDKKGKKVDPVKEIKEWAQAIITAVILALIIRTFLFEIILVDGSSMLPTLHDNDRVLVNKIGYRISEPQHGDVIIFKTPEDPKVNYVKRIIGLPGDRVRVENGIVYVNDIALDEPYIAEPPFNNYDEVVVPADKFFAMGDNRNASKDSRDPHVGFVPIENLLGEAAIRAWPITDFTLLK